MATDAAHGASVPIEIGSPSQPPAPSTYAVPDSGGLRLYLIDRPLSGLRRTSPVTPAARSVSVFLVNHRAARRSKVQQPDAAYAFQAEIEVHGERAFIPRPALRAGQTEEWDEQVADLHYRDTLEYATGHGVLAEWEMVDGTCRVLRTVWLPSADVKSTETAGVSDVELSMEALGTLADGAAAEAALSGLVTRYRAWIAASRSDTSSLSQSRRDTAGQLLHVADAAADRIERGIATLKEDAERKAQIAAALRRFDDADVMQAIEHYRHRPASEAPVKRVELDALLAAPEGYGDDVPVDPNFHARRLPERDWRRSEVCDAVEAVVQLHRLREVLALGGFTRFEAITPDIDGEYDSDVEYAQIVQEPEWFPAVENRGEGVFVLLRTHAVQGWLERAEVTRRLESLDAGHRRWTEQRRSHRPFPGGPYVLLHTLSHLLIQSLATSCGYPASSIRERIYADGAGGRFGVLLYTGSPDAEGTLGGLVQQARHLEAHIVQALRMNALCSNDPICSQHAPGESMEGRWLHGAACHGCALIAETSCEMRNDYLDRALVVPVIDCPGAALFPMV